MVEVGFLAAIMALSWYWLIPLCVLTVITVIAFWNEEPFGGVGVVLILGAIFYLIPGTFSAVLENPIMLLTILLVYVIIGFVWSFFKWYKKLISMRDRGVKQAPDAGDYKGVIICWAAYWPIGIIRYVLGDLLEDLFTSIWKRFRSVYQRISDKVFEIK